jgi:hypothetical protein
VTAAPVIVTLFDREDEILRATAAARQEGFEIVDVFTPYPVHGLDQAMGLGRSRLPWVCFVLGLAGAAGTGWLQYWASAVDWPIDVGGKPWHSWPAFVPVMFEVMVLFAGVGTVLFFIGWAGLRPGRGSAVSDLGVTDDRFALAIRLPDGRDDRIALDAFVARVQPVRVVERALPPGAPGSGR